MILMNWNIEHMNSWWEGGNNDPAIMRTTFAGNNFSPAITDVPALAARVGAVINAVGPDIVTIQEGAGIPEMNHFFGEFVDHDWHIFRGSGGGQALDVAVRLDGDVSAVEAGPEQIGAIDLNLPYTADIDADLVLEEKNFTRKPQVLSITTHGQSILLLNNHLKSKSVPNARERFEAGGDDRLSFFRDSLEVRRRISGEAYRIRSYLDERFTEDPQARIIVTGDLNDGPGADFFEENFLTHSVVDRVFGSIFEPSKRLSHVLFDSGSTDFTAQFFDFIAGETKDLVLDHVGLSQGIVENWDWQGRVAVAEYEAQRVDDNTLEERDRLPSDHRPVVLEMTPL